MIPPWLRLPPIVHRPVVFEWLAAPLPAQLHASAVPWDGVLRARPQEVTIGHWFKPKCGLWTSSERADGESAWLDLCRDPAQEEAVAVEVHRYEVIGAPRIGQSCTAPTRSSAFTARSSAAPTWSASFPTRPPS
jgi:hypothetical protein